MRCAAAGRCAGRARGGAERRRDDRVRRRVDAVGPVGEVVLLVRGHARGAEGVPQQRVRRLGELEACVPHAVGGLEHAAHRRPRRGRIVGVVEREWAERPRAATRIAAQRRRALREEGRGVRRERVAHRRVERCVGEVGKAHPARVRGVGDGHAHRAGDHARVAAVVREERDRRRHDAERAAERLGELGSRLARAIVAVAVDGDRRQRDEVGADESDEFCCSALAVPLGDEHEHGGVPARARAVRVEHAGGAALERAVVWRAVARAVREVLPLADGRARGLRLAEAHGDSVA